MRIRIVMVVMVVALVIAPLAGGVPSQAVAQGFDSPLMRMLATVPFNENTPEWVQFGDVAAWYTAWNIPHVPSLQALDLLPRLPHAYWMMVMPRQTQPPDVMGLNSLIFGDQRSFYGFDFFDVERFITAGNPPDDVTVVQHRADAGEIGATLVASGYEAESLTSRWTLYRILEDYETAIGADVEIPQVGMVGQRNRIALRDDQMIIGRATPLVTGVLDAMSGDTPSMVEVVVYWAAAQALADPFLEDTGPLVGAIMMPGPVIDDPTMALLGATATKEQRDALLAELGDLYAPGSLPVYDLVVFATAHSADAGATYLTMGLVFPTGTDAKAAADVVVERLETYVSARYDRPLSEFWTFDRAAAVDVYGVPVALVTMRIDDPSPATDDSGMPNTAVLSWGDLVYARDIGFLAASAPTD